MRYNIFKSHINGLVGISYSSLSYSQSVTITSVSIFGVIWILGAFKNLRKFARGKLYKLVITAEG